MNPLFSTTLFCGATGKGVTVEFLAQFLDDPEWPVERLCQNYGLTPGEVFAAWSFYHDHRAEIERHIQSSESSG